MDKRFDRHTGSQIKGFFVSLGIKKIVAFMNKLY